MKFYCPSCEAKYRIADEKMATRATPRMKCRKCGLMIDIRAHVVLDDGDDGAAMTVATLRPELPAPHGAPAAPLPLPPAVPGGGLLGQDLDTAKLASAVAVSAGTLRDLAGPAGGPPAKPVPQAPILEAPPPPPVSAPDRSAHEAGPVSSMPFSRGFMDLQEAAGLKKSRSIPLLGWVLVALAYGLGIATGAFVFQMGAGAAVAPPVASVAPPTTEGAADPEPASELAALSGHAPAASAEPASAQTKTGSVTQAARPPAGAAPSPTGRGLLSGLQPGEQVGPAAGPSVDDNAPVGGGQLSSADIQKTVSAQQSGVRRGCWERALNARDMGAPSTARVNVSISVAPSGQVTRVSSAGDPPGYPGLATCIENRVRTWTFPRSGEQTTVNVPFVFTAQ